MKKIITVLFLAWFFNGLKAQQDSSCNIQISLLTCSPGEELYSTFGHSALRIIDSSSNTDIIYNYGTFDFDDPAFYSKFTRGNLMYFVSLQKFQSFVEWQGNFHVREEYKRCIERISGCTDLKNRGDNPAFRQI